MIVQHSFLRTKGTEDSVDVERRVTSDQPEVASDARVVHRKHVEPPESA
jgi:hypothetical protein